MLGDHHKLFGLLGRKLGHSFSRPYFTEKFRKENLVHFAYENFEIPLIGDFPKLWTEHHHLLGMNVTLPYKEAVIPYLDKLDPVAREVGAVNTIARHQEDGLIGYNTDVIGFHASLSSMLAGRRVSGALILGTGGASKAVAFVLRTMKIPSLHVSRNPEGDKIGYSEINRSLLHTYPLIINTTPLGMHPQTETFPPIPYTGLGPENALFDLVYNPEKTVFLQEGEKRGCRCMNGMEMLVLQAEASWKIWNQHLN